MANKHVKRCSRPPVIREMKTKTTMAHHFPGGASGKEPACQCKRCKRCGFDPWVGKTPWRRAWQPTPVFLPGKSPWTGEQGRLQTIGSQRVGHDWNDLARMHTTSHPWEILKKTSNTKCWWCGAHSYVAPSRFSWLFLWIECWPCLHTVTITAESLSYPHWILWSVARHLHSIPIHSWLRCYCCLHHYRKGDWGSEISDFFFF